MKITFLGTGTSQGVPVIACRCPVCLSPDRRDKRLRTSVMIENKGKVFVIDTGPDFRQQMLAHNVQQLDAVIFTHEHRDHIAGLDDVRAFNFIQQKIMPVYAPADVKRAIHRDFYYAFEEIKYPGVLEIEIVEVENKEFSVEGTSFLPVEVMHHKLPVFGYRVGGFSYVTDAKTIAPAEREKLKGSDVLVLNALRRSEHFSHFNLDEAVKMIEILQPKMAYLTHISHLMGTHEEVEKILPPHIRIACDGLTLNLDE
ncbi:MAG: MBL fold metallo-hydrolase [Bacteroidota bacterium]